MCWFESADFQMPPPDIELKLYILLSNFIVLKDHPPSLIRMLIALAVTVNYVVQAKHSQL
jgi:hypothetical protein